MTKSQTPTKKSQHKLSAFIGGWRNPLKKKSPAAPQDAAPAHGSFPQSSHTEAMMPVSPPPAAEENIITVVSREVEDDVSTLQEPYIGWGETIPEPHADETFDGSMVSSEHKGYVWAVGRERLSTGGGSSTVMTGGTNAFLMDDKSYERTYQDGYRERGSSFERFTVIAPSGKLGIVVDNQTGDMPVIVAVKETSVLHGKLRSDDVLISVDEIDCRGLSAVQVSKLISQRSHNSARTLVLGRTTVSC